MLLVIILKIKNPNKLIDHSTSSSLKSNDVKYIKMVLEDDIKAIIKLFIFNKIRPVDEYIFDKEYFYETYPDPDQNLDDSEIYKSLKESENTYTYIGPYIKRIYDKAQNQQLKDL